MIFMPSLLPYANHDYRLQNSNNNADSDDETHTDMLTKVEVQSIITEVNESCIRATKCL